MSLVQQIDQDFLEAMRQKDKDLVSLLRMVKATLQNKKIEKGIAKDQELEDADVIVALKNEVKKRLDAATTYQENNRADLAQSEQKEAEGIGKYLPPALDESVIATAIDEVIAQGAGDFGAVMGQVMAKLQGQADGQVVSRLVKERLSSPKT
jgi:uncharacterized protein YqeY